AFGLDMTRGHLLQTIVANGRSRLQRFLGIARLELDPSRSQSSAFRSRVSPDAGKTVRLQLERNRRTLRPWPSIARGPVVQAEQLLYVVAELVRHDVGLRKVAGSAEASGQLVEEPEIEIDLSISGTVEGPGRGIGASAGRLRRVPEENHTSPLVAAAENLLPRGLRVGHHGVYEVDQPLFFRRRPQLSARAGLLGRRSTPADQREKISPGRPAERQQQHHPSDANRHNATRTRAAPLVLDVAAIASLPTHLDLLLARRPASCRTLPAARSSPISLLSGCSMSFLYV